MSTNQAIDKFTNPLQALRELNKVPGLRVELCGSWVWVDGDTVKHKAMLKARGLFWSPSKKMWFFKGNASRNTSGKRWSIDEIRNFHGSRGLGDVDDGSI